MSTTTWPAEIGIGHPTHDIPTRAGSTRGTEAAAMEWAARRARLVASSAAEGLWRIVDRRGLVVGHIQRVTSSGGARFRAQRYHPATRSFRTLGEFWTCDQAMECVRFSR